MKSFGRSYMQGFRPCTPLKGLLKKSIKNLQNFRKHYSSNAFQSFLESRTFFAKKVLVGVRGQSPLKKRFTG
jgi:hypothetical protein